jgi:cytochrome bd-type quinol oxidase subunit 2
MTPREGSDLPGRRNVGAQTEPARPTTGTGPGRVLVAVYAILAIAATFRSAVQIARDLDSAPVAYLLSALAAVVYLLATVALARGTGTWRRIAWAAVTLELVGVLTVGALSLTTPELFPEATVWSGFGQGYGYVPMVLPVLGLLWLRRTVPADRPTDPSAPPPDR